MGIIEGPFGQYKCMGASIMSISSTVGWNEQASTVSMTLVEDPLLRDRFLRPGMGTPAGVSIQGFQFQGIVQRWVETNSLEGKPTFELSLTDPRECLAGTQVIMSSFRGNVGVFANVLNVYGFWENRLGYGGSMVNESGMLWRAPFEVLDTQGINNITLVQDGWVGVQPAIQYLTQNPASSFGGPLSFFGHKYAVDLSGLPLPPAYYRVGSGVNMSLLDLVTEICQDGGSDYICFLDGNTIRFRTVSRLRQPDPGQIANFVNSQPNVMDSSLGYEMRNDITNAFLIGGDVTEMVQEFNPNMDDTIWPFWGFDVDGNVIVGQGQPEVDHTAMLNSSPIADIMGSTQYPCGITEMRCALMNFDSWAAYVLKNEPDKAATINLVCAIDCQSDFSTLFPDGLFQRDLIAANDDASYYFGRMNESEYWTQRVQRVYDFVRTYAYEFFGRKFLVRIPFYVYWKFDPETTHRISSDEPTDAGYMPEGSTPLGLNFLNESFFATPDGRFQCFVRFDNGANIDVQQMSPDSGVMQGNYIYLRASVDQEVGIVYPPNSISPYCVVNLDNHAYNYSPDPLGGVDEIASVLGADPSAVAQAAALRHGSFPIRIHPAPNRPNAIALPMKSNRDSYGPWSATGGADGKVNFERDEGLVPWNYGDFGTMNLAAQAKLANIATAQQYTETGTVKFAGTPDHSLGDDLVVGGPQLTGIDLSISLSGVTTTYRMQTYTPRLVGFNRDNADRLRRLGMAAQDLRRSVRALFQRRLQSDRLANATQFGFMANTSRAVQQATPHDCLLGIMTFDARHGWRTQVSSQTTPELVANARGDNPAYWVTTGAMGLEGLLRPFSTNWLRDADDAASNMPHYEAVVNQAIQVSGVELNPFGAACDVDYMCWGDTYPGAMHGLKQTPDPNNSRLLGLRGPMVMVGWGYTYTGKPIPNAAPVDDQGNPLPEDQWSDSFLSSHRTHPESWRAGPIGLYWDNWRKVWTIPTLMFGTLDGPMDPDDGVLMTPDFMDGDNPDRVRVYQKFTGGTYRQGMNVCAGYHPQLNKWFVIATDC